MGITYGGIGGNYNQETYVYDAQGRIETMPGLGDYAYLDVDHVHAVTHIDDTQKYWYDDNGNMITRTVGTDSFNLSYNAENRLVAASGGSETVDYGYTYNGDDQMVIEATGTITTVYIGGIYKYVISGAEAITRSYYYAGSQRVAMREGGELFYLLGDHLGSTSLTLDASGNKVAEQRYKPYGSTRYEWGTAQTDYQYTGQRWIWGSIITRLDSTTLL